MIPHCGFDLHFRDVLYILFMFLRGHLYILLGKMSIQDLGPFLN